MLLDSVYFIKKDVFSVWKRHRRTYLEKTQENILSLWAFNPIQDFIVSFFSLPFHL